MDINPSEYNTYTYKHCVRLGLLNSIVWLDKHNKYDTLTYTEAFCLANAHGHLDIVKYLVDQVPLIDIEHNDCEAFRFACAHGHLSAVTWISDHYDVDVHIGDEYAFMWSAINGHLEVSKYLWRHHPDIRLDIYNHYIFKTVCANGRLEVALWLTTIDRRYYVITRGYRILKYGVK
jgi:hypothetical protein